MVVRRASQNRHVPPWQYPIKYVEGMKMPNESLRDAPGDIRKPNRRLKSFDVARTTKSLKGALEEQSKKSQNN